MQLPISRSQRATVLALLGTASFLTIAGTVAAQAQGNPPAVEEVLVTGSLIRGAPAVGVPVTALSDQDFKETGALTIGDLLRDVPAVTVTTSLSATLSGGNSTRAQQTAIHNISKGTGTETLLMIDGMRYPLQGTNAAFTDPSIIPQLAVDRIDVLADGASATYGSDAVAGVLNVILKRGFEGAISQVRYARSWDINGSNYNAAQLYGTKWNSGSVTLSYEWYHEDDVPGQQRDYYTANFEPYGFDDKTQVAQANPGVVSTGALVTIPALLAQGFTAAVGTRACSNCYSIPAGAGWNYGDTPAHTNPTDPGSAPTTTWTALLANAGVKNLLNSYAYASMLPASQRNGATITFDQTLANDIFGVLENVSLFADGFYSNRQTRQFYSAGSSPSATTLVKAQVVPTTNPYYPSGAPAGLRVSYNLAAEHPPRGLFIEVARRYDFGFTADLPADWRGRLYYSMSEDGNHQQETNLVNTNMISAALGNTVPAVAANGATPGQAAFTKPANVPYLNLFCDATQYQCNSPITESYIDAYLRYDELWKVGETGLNLDGPVIELPGGTVRAAVGVNALSQHFYYLERTTFAAANTSVPNGVYDPNKRGAWAAFGQVNVPLVGEMNQIPLVEAFNIEAALRYDRYYEFGGVTTPKLAATWTVGYGFSLRGTWGKSFRTPNFGEASAVQNALIQGINTNSGAANGVITLNCPAVPGLSTGTTANAGSLNGYLNPTCSNAAALQTPVGVTVGGSGGAAAPLRPPGDAISPERAKNWAVGVNFAPKDFLAGINIDLTMYHIRIDDVIDNNTGGVNINDPVGLICTAPTHGCLYIVRANPNLPITDPVNATFLALVNSVLLSPKSQASPSIIPNVEFINDNAVTNIGWREIEGLDMNSRYDFDLGDWGLWDVGVTGNYRLQDKRQTRLGTAINDALAANSGGVFAYRGRIGWTSAGGPSEGLSITAFVNHIPHGSAGNTAIPKCFWAVGFSAGSCYPGSPYWGPYTVFPGGYPGLYTFDLSLGYQTGTRPANTYLQNINFQFTVNDLFNKAPPFAYIGTVGRANASATDATIAPQQRYISFAVTKAW